MEPKIAVQIQFDADSSAMLRSAAKAGFPAVSIGFGSFEGFVFDDWREKIVRLKEELASLGLLCVMTHAPYYDLRVSAEYVTPAIDLSIARCLEATALLGAEIMAMHPRGYYSAGSRYEGEKSGLNLAGLTPEIPAACFSCGVEDLARSVETNIAYWKPLAARARELGCLIGVENLPVWPGWGMTFCSNDPGAQIAIIDGLGEGACGVWDFGHANLANGDDPGPLRRLGRRVRGLHVHDNKGASDDHAIPFEGTIDWPAQMKELRAAGFEGYVMLELAYTYGGHIEAFLARAYRAAIRLDKLLRNGA